MPRGEDDQLLDDEDKDGEDSVKDEWSLLWAAPASRAIFCQSCIRYDSRVLYVNELLSAKPSKPPRPVEEGKVGLGTSLELSKGLRFSWRGAGALGLPDKVETSKSGMRVVWTGVAPLPRTEPPQKPLREPVEGKSLLRFALASEERVFRALVLVCERTVVGVGVSLAAALSKRLPVRPSRMAFLRRSISFLSSLFSLLVVESSSL